MKALIEEDEDFTIPMTPMIDIVFLLLIFFLLATTIQEEEVDIRVNLPGGEAGNVAGAAAGRRLVVNVRKDGSASLGGRAISWPELRQRLKDEGRRKQKPRVYLRGDREAPYGRVAEVLQVCQEAGLDRINCEFRFEPRP